MDRVCAWCENNLEETAGSIQDRPVTHGICDSCAAALLKDTYEDWVENLGAPVVVLGSGSQIAYANALALDRLGKQGDSLSGKRWGDAISCTESFKSGGCGCQKECPGCAVYQALAEVFATGRSVVDVRRVYRKPSGDQSVSISVEKIGEMLFIQLDSINVAGMQ